MKDTSVIVTTANRPAELPRALQSIAAQSAVERICEVVVIENGGNATSRDVCGAFPSLPIRYVFNVPSRPIDAYLMTTFVESALRGEYCALLHDDDVWMEHHLAASLGSLEMHAEAVACWSACGLFRDDGHATMFAPFFPWFVTGYARTVPRVVCSPEQALLANLFSTSFHYSTVVGRTAPIVGAIASARPLNPYDSDRTLVLLASRCGDVVFNTTPSAWIWQHAGQDSASKRDSDESIRWWNHTGDQITTTLLKHGVDPAAALRSLMAARRVSAETVVGFETYGSVRAFLAGDLRRPRRF
jgi:hypothetical protein